MLYIEAMQEAREDLEFDPLRNDQVNDRKRRSLCYEEKSNEQAKKPLDGDVPMFRVGYIVRYV